MDVPNGSFEGPSLQQNQLDEFEYNFNNFIKEHTDKVGALEANHKRAEDKLSSEVSKSQAKVDLLDQSIAAKEKQVLVDFLWLPLVFSLTFDRVFLGFIHDKQKFSKMNQSVDSINRAIQIAPRTEAYHINEKESTLKNAEEKMKKQEPKLTKKLKNLKDEASKVDEQRNALSFKVAAARENVETAQKFEGDAMKVQARQMYTMRSPFLFHVQRPTLTTFFMLADQNSRGRYCYVKASP
jgi:hypothetical protein